MQTINEKDIDFILALKNIQNRNPTTIATLIPNYEKIYYVDLSSRKIEEPKEIITIESDHMAETIYFKIPRYFDNVDLSRMVCVIQYVNANQEDYIYPVPFCDVESLSYRDIKNGIEEPMMLIPWTISGGATKKSGIIKFVIRFFKLDSTGSYFTYNISTLPSQLKIQNSININTSIKEDSILYYLTNENGDLILDDEGKPIPLEVSSDWEQFLDEAKKYIELNQAGLHWIVL